MPAKLIVQRVREKSPKLEIILYLNDLPDNRFDKAFQTVLPAFKDVENFYVMAIGKDFTNQVFPNNHIDIGFTTLTCMILASQPSPLTGNILFQETPENASSHTSKLWTSALETHFTSFILSRY